MNKENIITVMDTKTFNETVILKFNKEFFKYLHAFISDSWNKIRRTHSDSEIMKMSHMEIVDSVDKICDRIIHSEKFKNNTCIEQSDAMYCFRELYNFILMPSLIKNCIASNTQDKFLDNLQNGIMAVGRLYYKSAPFLVYDFDNDPNKSEAENFRDLWDYEIEFLEKKNSNKDLLADPYEEARNGFFTKEWCYDPYVDPNNTYDAKYYFFDYIPPRYFKIIASAGLGLDTEYMRSKYSNDYTFITQYSDSENKIHQKRLYCKPYVPSVEAIEEDIDFNDTQEIDIVLLKNKHVNALKDIKHNDTIIVTGRMKYNADFDSTSIMPFTDASIHRGYTGGKVINHEIVTANQLNQVGEMVVTIRCKVMSETDRDTVKILKTVRSCHNPVIQNKLPDYINEQYEDPNKQNTSHAPTNEISIPPVPQFRPPII